MQRPENFTVEEWAKLPRWAQSKVHHLWEEVRDQREIKATLEPTRVSQPLGHRFIREDPVPPRYLDDTDRVEFALEGIETRDYLGPILSVRINSENALEIMAQGRTARNTLVTHQPSGNVLVVWAVDSHEVPR